MPSDQSTWLISVPQGHDPQGLIQNLGTKLTQQAKLPPRNIGQLVIPSFKVKIHRGLIKFTEPNNHARPEHSMVLFLSQKTYPSKMLSSLLQSQRM